jgi:hypothetical protein
MSWFGLLTRKLSVIYNLGGGVDPGFGLIDALPDRSVEPHSTGFCRYHR